MSTTNTRVLAAATGRHAPATHHLSPARTRAPPSRSLGAKEAGSTSGNLTVVVNSEGALCGVYRPVTPNEKLRFLLSFCS